jgi:murein DD-endopeptidase MepM/ murein hydrolase activator NlpD
MGINKSTYIVVSGDTLWGISKKFGVSVDQLARWNNITNIGLIRPGQILIVKHPVSVCPEILRKKSNLPTPPSDNTYKKKLDTGQDSVRGQHVSKTDSYNRVLNYLNMGLSFGSTGASIYYSYNSPVMSLHKNNQFLLTDTRGIERATSLNFRSGRYAPSALVQMQRANFLNTIKWIKGIKYGGWVLGGVSTLYSLYNFRKNPNWQDGIDTGVGIASFLYWPIGVSYGTVQSYMHLSSSQFKLQEEAKKKLTSKESFWTSVWNSFAYYPGRFY